MMRFFKGLTALFLFAVLLIQTSGISPSIAADSYGELMVTVPHTAEISLWHYSGGYWGNPGYNIQIDDSQIEREELLAEALNKRIELKMPLPAEVKTEIAKGDSVKAVCSANNGLSLFELFYMNKGEFEFRYDKDYLYFSVFPKFHIIKKKKFVPLGTFFALGYFAVCVIIIATFMTS